MLCWPHPILTNLPSPEERAPNVPIGFNGLDQSHLEPPQAPLANGLLYSKVQELYLRSDLGFALARL